MNLNDFNEMANSASIVNSHQKIKNVEKRFPENKTLNQDFKRTILITVIGFLPIGLIPLFLLFSGIHWGILLLIGTFATIITLIIGVIIKMKVIEAGLSTTQRIVLDEGYGQFVWLNNEAYMTAYIKPHSQQQAVAMVSQYLNKQEIPHGFHIYKLLDIKHRKTKRYRGKRIDIIDFTYDMITNPIKFGDERLYSIKLPIYHDDVFYNRMSSLPTFRETEEDRIKDIRKGFILTTFVLVFSLWMPTTNLFIIFIAVGLPILVAWECASNEIQSHKLRRFLLQLYIIGVCLVGFWSLFLHMGVI